MILPIVRVFGDFLNLAPPRPADVPAVLLDNEVMFQVKNQLEMIIDGEENKALTGKNTIKFYFDNFLAFRLNLLLCFLTK
jgi:hypothetical protein